MVVISTHHTSSFYYLRKKSGASLGLQEELFFSGVILYIEDPT